MLVRKFEAANMMKMAFRRRERSSIWRRAREDSALAGRQKQIL